MAGLIGGVNVDIGEGAGHVPVHAQLAAIPLWGVAAPLWQADVRLGVRF